jgi:hypothetical protein
MPLCLLTVPAAAVEVKLVPALRETALTLIPLL